MSDQHSRRDFVRQAATGSAALAWLSSGSATSAPFVDSHKPAALGGVPAHRGDWPAWPQWDQAWEPEIVETLRSGEWSSGGQTGPLGEFESAYATMLGARGCVATSSGTAALLTALRAIGVDAGDEVIVSPYTFVATYNAILAHKALPVFADTDPETLTIDPASIECRITERTRAIVPVHIFGIPCDMDPINAIAQKHSLAVVEDACQAWLAEYKGRKCGALADLGCFSFQNSKHLTSGEGGAVVGDDSALLDRARSYHDCGRSYGSYAGQGFFNHGLNYRLTHYQGSLLRQQLGKLTADTERRRQNADRLAAALRDVPGVAPVRLPDGARPAWHLFPLRYDPQAFHGLTRAQFQRALAKEGIPTSAAYSEQYHDGLLDQAIASRGFQRLFSAERLKAYRASFAELRGNKQVCETTVALFHTLLLAEREDVDAIADAIVRIQANSASLV